MNRNAERDVVTELPSAGDIPLSQLFTLDRAVLVDAIDRIQATMTRPEDAIAAFSNFVSASP